MVTNLRPAFIRSTTSAPRDTAHVYTPEWDWSTRMRGSVSPSCPPPAQLTVSPGPAAPRSVQFRVTLVPALAVVNNNIYIIYVSTIYLAMM